MLRSAGSQSRAVGFLFPPGCSVLLPRGSTGRRRQEADHIAAPDGHPQGALDEEEEGGAGGGGRNRSKCIWPRGVEMSFTGGGEGLRRAKPVSCLPASRGWRPQLSHLPHAQLRPAGASFSQKASSSAGLGTLRSPSTRQKKKKNQSNFLTQPKDPFFKVQSKSFHSRMIWAF